jgi:hypothetical protein
MKSVRGRKSPFLRTATISHIADRSVFDDLRERPMDVVAWIALAVMVVALYAVMVMALYRWNAYAPIFQPDRGAAAEQALPWPE